MKKGNFKCLVAKGKAFSELERKVTKKLILALLNFDKLFQVNCDSSGTTIGEVLSQEGRPITFFSDKLNNENKKYFVYDKKKVFYCTSLKEVGTLFVS